MIRASNISYNINGKNLLNDISADFETGALHLIIGPNGAGKSTLIKILSGQLAAGSGELLYDNKDIGSFSTAQLATFRSVLSQSLELSFPLKVWEVVMMGRYPHFAGKSGVADVKACEEAMQLFNVHELAERDYTTLSGGEKQRVHFARVMGQIWYPVKERSRCLLLDEPLTFLDVHYQYQFMQLIKDIIKDQNIIVIGVVHDLNLASKFADKITLLHNGSILATGNTEEVLNAENIKTAYGVLPEIISHNGKSYLIF